MKSRFLTPLIAVALVVIFLTVSHLWLSANMVSPSEVQASLEGDWLQGWSAQIQDCNSTQGILSTSTLCSFSLKGPGKGNGKGSTVCRRSLFTSAPSCINPQTTGIDKDGNPWACAETETQSYCAFEVPPQ